MVGNSSWGSIESTLRGVLEENNFGIEAQDEIMSRMKDFYENLISDVNFSSKIKIPASVPKIHVDAISNSISNHQEDLNEHLGKLFTKILQDRFLLETELRKHKGSFRNDTEEH